MSIFLHVLFFALQSFAAEPFSEADLLGIMENSKRGGKTVIYSWSPHMVLSQKGLNEILADSALDPSELIVVLDPKGDPELAKKIAAERGWPESVLRQMASATLIGKGIRVHYPSYIFIQHGKFRGGLVPGYKSPEQFHRLLRDKFQ